jgi:hypothetical protein
MKKRVSFVLSLALFVGMLGSATTTACAQESGAKTASQSTSAKNTQEKGTKEQSATDKSKEEMPLSESSANFPQVGGPVELRAPRGTRITLKLADSSVVVYQAIASQAKISVLFDPDYVPRNISVDLKGVPLEDALKIVAFQSRTFWRPVTSDSIFVTQDTQAKRHEFGQQIVKSYYLPNIATPTDMQDVVNAIRTILEVQRIQQMPAYQTITVRASPDQMAIVDKLVEDLNQAKQKTGGRYRLEFKITEGSEDKKTARIYAMVIDPRESGKLRIGQKVPILIKDGERTYTDVGKNIDCNVLSENEHSVNVRLAVEFSDILTDEHGTQQSAHGDPVIQRVSLESHVTLELGTPTIVGNFQDPVTRRSFQIEVTANRAKSKE